MSRIIALNDKNTAPESDEIVATKEAQETIVANEYVRAITLKINGKWELSLSLLSQLLRTCVLNKINKEESSELWNIRYNCHKNIAMIFEERGEFESALKNYVWAAQYDNSDVNNLYRLGKLALKLEHDDLAEDAFELCLRQNKKHWAAADGLLLVYTKNYNILGAYGLAIKLLQSKSCSARANNTLMEIFANFKKIIPLCEQLNDVWPARLPQLKNKYLKSFSVFDLEKPEEAKKNCLAPHNLPLLNSCELSFYSIGAYMISLFNHLQHDGRSILFEIIYSSLYCNKNEASKSNMDYEDNGQISQEHENDTFLIVTNDIKNGTSSKEFQTPENNVEMNFDLLNERSDDDNSKTKPRRRCSDLHLLEQWGWHKSRKTRKKAQYRHSDFENTLSGFLKSIFPTFMNVSFEEQFVESIYLFKMDTNFKCETCLENVSKETFGKDTIDRLSEFVHNLKQHKMDLIHLNFLWLDEISKFWSRTLPEDVKKIYVDIFSLYFNLVDFSSWSQYTLSYLESMFRMSLFYLELQYSEAIKNVTELSNDWKKILQFLKFLFGALLIESNCSINTFQIRLLYIEYLQNEMKNDDIKCVEILELLKKIFCEKPHSYILHLPNMKSFCVSLKTVDEACNKAKRNIKLKRIPEMYTNSQWHELSSLIKEEIYNDCQKDENGQIDFKNMYKLLLRSFWNNVEYEECLKYAEKFFHISTCNFLQYMKRSWTNPINYSLSYIQAIIFVEGCDTVMSLKELLSRLVQNIISLLTFILDDEDTEKKSSLTSELEMYRMWIILHQILIREENNNSLHFEDSNLNTYESKNDFLPNSFLILFTAHEYIGKNQSCTSDGGKFLQYVLKVVISNLRAPIYDSCRHNVFEYIEQITYCLFRYPPKKARSRHLEDHNSTQVELTWVTAIDIFDIYAPEYLPEFNSYKFESISSDMEHFFLRVLSLLPEHLKPENSIKAVKNFINGSINNYLSISSNLPFKIKNIYYLLADYYFKSRDFNKAIKYYIYDLAENESRFDSWAGISLSKASNIETKLNGFTRINFLEFLSESDEVVRCFDKCISLMQNHILVWIEYGSFAYTIGAFCSRSIRENQNKNNFKWKSIFQEKETRMLNIAYNCFSLAATLQNSDQANKDCKEEKWLCQYMLGKIAEKRRENPSVYLNYYLAASNYLYECNATYPIKINHSNPTPLSVEALEVFYRINSAIMKYLERNKNVLRSTSGFFLTVLKQLSNSPFAFNKAKIDGNSLNALKRKNAGMLESSLNKKFKKISKSNDNLATNNLLSGKEQNDYFNSDDINLEPTNKFIDIRRHSQESVVTASTISTSSSTLATDSDSSSTDNQSENSLYINSRDLEEIYEEVIKNLEECVARFPEHYKSIYRIVYFFMNGPPKYKNLNKCEKLLLHQYQTSVGNVICGLFYDRKTNNIFNGVWRIPSSEIDRPGSFASHLVKCVNILIDLLKKNCNYSFLSEIILQLQKTPDNDKRYIMDTQRIELLEKAIIFCEKVLNDNLEKFKNKRNDEEVLNFLIDIYKIQKKFLKYMVPKIDWIFKVFTSTYLFYIEDKIENIPKNLNFIDLAVKLCLQEINYRKNIDKHTSIQTANTNDNCSTNTQDISRFEECSQVTFDATLLDTDLINQPTTELSIITIPTDVLDSTIKNEM